MKKLIITTFAVAVLASTAALASGTGNRSEGYCGGSKQGDWMDVGQVRSKLSGLGYAVRKIELDDGCYEAYATDRNGQLVEIYLDPVSGKVRKIELDD